MTSPIPQVGRPDHVTLAGVQFVLEPGTYVCAPAEKFADKISQGAIRYEDFNQYQSAWEIISCAGGYGLRRYSDLPSEDPSRRTKYFEAENVDCREDGIVRLGPEVTVGGAAMTGTPIWIGEYTPSTGADAGTEMLVAVCDDGTVYRINSNLTATLRMTLSDPPRQGAIGTFDGALIIGYGSTRTAQYTTDLLTTGNVVNATPGNIYVWAFTADRAAAYVAGGPNATDWNKVVSSETGINAYSAPANEVPCGTGDDLITALAPGGGIVTVFVGLETGLGCIDSNGLYRELVPFDSKLSTNCQLLRWYLAAGGEEQRGPVVLFFSRDRDLWSYQPSSENAGEAKNMSPWAAPAIRPENIRGRITALQGTARWLYYVVLGSSTGESWLAAQDSRTGAVHAGLVALEGNSCQAMTLSSLFDGDTPYLYIGYGNGIAAVSADAETPRFALTGSIDLPEVDWDFPDESKILFSVRFIADNLVPASRYIEVHASYDDGDFEYLTTIANSPATVNFPASTDVRRVGLRLVLYGDSATVSPSVRASVVRGSINPQALRIWQWTAKVPAGSHAQQGDDLQNAKTSIDAIWTAYENGGPTDYKDRWGDGWDVRILHLQEKETIRESDRTPETALSLVLLEVNRSGEGAGIIYDEAESIYDEPTSIYS